MQKILATLPLILALAFGLLWWNESTRHTAWVISDENQPIELITFGALFVGGLIGLRFTWSLFQMEPDWKMRLFYGAFSLGLLLIAMEEISWGQWFFDFNTPEALRGLNQQNELNLHNVGPLHGKGSSMRLAFAGGAMVGFLLGGTALMERIRPPLAILPWVLVILLCAGLELMIDLNLVDWNKDFMNLMQNVMPELTEMLVGIAAFLYIWINRMSYGKPKAGA
jgi:hypothetical protein